MEESLFFKNNSFFTKSQSNAANEGCDNEISNLAYRNILTKNTENIKSHNRNVAYQASKYQ